MSLFAETSFGSLKKKEQELCGDKVVISRKGEETIAILADGLGSGVKANILATLTSTIIKIMLEGGAPMSEVVETLVNTLPVCMERKIAYCTFTIIRIDEEGFANVVEYDNPEVIFLRDGVEVLPEKKQIFLHGKAMQGWSYQLMAGDVLLAVSDGVTAASLDNLVINSWKRENVVSFLKSLNPAVTGAFSLKKNLLSECDERYMGNVGDDSTVLLCKMERIKRVNIMIGPPLDKNKDEEVVSEFLKIYGLHIICGGSTARIVERITGKEIHVLKAEDHGEVPPMSQMEDVDLITEGALTVTKTAELLENIDEISFREYNRMQYSENGAERLLYLLLNGGNNITIFLGNAQNPAHYEKKQIDYGEKNKKVERIAELLREQGKHVVIKPN